MLKMYRKTTVGKQSKDAIIGRGFLDYISLINQNPHKDYKTQFISRAQRVISNTTVNNIQVLHNNCTSK